MSLAFAIQALDPPPEARLLEQRLASAIADHYRGLRRVIRRLGVQEFEVDDVLQDAYLAFFRKAASIHPQAERQFLLQSAFRVVLGRQRGFARRREDLEPGFEHLREARPSPEEELSQRQSLAILDGILGTMPLELRMVFSLCDIEQMSVREAAAVLEVPVGTASSRLRRARELFAKNAARVRASEKKER